MTEQEATEPDEEFDQFKNLTKRLLAVSKEDLDRQRTADQDPPQNGARGKTAPG
jgi:hypothetical protein